MWIVLWSWTSCAAASYSMRRSFAPLYPRPAYASFTSYAVANMQISLPSGATNAMSSSARMVCAFAVANAQGRPTPITTTTSMKTFSNVELSQLIHHSDRGVQYCCNEYVDKLKSLGIQISMTQTGDPLHNALAERMNNTLKNGWLFSTEDKSLQQVRRLTKKAIELYNTFRPHQSLQMRTPMEEVGRLTA